jgi:fatty-acid desaturase
MTTFQSDSTKLTLMTAVAAVVALVGVCLSPSLLWLLGSLVAFQVYWCCGYSAGNHRYFCHRSFKTSKFWEEFMVWASCSSLGGHPLLFASSHLEHHQHSDTDKDPNNAYKRVWLAAANEPSVEMPIWMKRNFVKSPLMMRAYRYYLLYPIITATILCLISPVAMIYLWAIPLLITQIARKHAMLDWVHSFGYQSYDTGDKSTNSLILSLLFGGEGLHNNHHKYPARWNFVMKKGEIDPTSWFVRMIKK